MRLFLQCMVHWLCERNPIKRMRQRSQDAGRKPLRAIKREAPVQGMPEAISASLQEEGAQWKTVIFPSRQV